MLGNFIPLSIFEFKLDNFMKFQEISAEKSTVIHETTWKLFDSKSFKISYRLDSKKAGKNKVIKLNSYLLFKPVSEANLIMELDTWTKIESLSEM